MAAISFPSSLLCRGLSAEAFSAVFYMDARASHSPEKHSAAESPWPPSEVNIVDVCSGKAQMHGAHNFWLVPKPTNITLAHTKGLLLQVVCRHTSLSGMVSALGWVFIMQEFQLTCCCAIHTIEEQGHEEIHFLLPFFISTVVIFFDECISVEQNILPVQLNFLYPHFLQHRWRGQEMISLTSAGRL